MRTDKQLHEEARAGQDALGTEDIANANPRMETAAEPRDDTDLRMDDMPDSRADDADMRTEELTVTGTPVDGSDTMTERAPEDDVPPTVELFPAQEVERFRGEWTEIQTRFVDDPRDAVRDADQLVAEVMRSLATTFTNHKHELEGRWQQGDHVETEELRQALRQYRSFFNHLLEV
jgi:hypothetical protein